MPISFRCPQCGKSFKADDSFAGKNVRCKQCGTKTTVPSPSSGDQTSGSQAPEPDDLYGLAEPAPMLPPRAPLPRNEVTSSTPKRKTKATPSKSSTGVKKGAPWAALAIGVLILRVFLRLNRGNQGLADNPVIPPQDLSSIVATAPAGPPAFPQRGPGTLIRPGVRVFEARASGPSNVATTNMSVWAYLPDGAHDRRSLPCVIIAPAGSIIITGMELGDGDRAEHFPYVAAGYAVLAYSLDGYVDKLEQLTDPRLAPTCAQFVAARAGLSNAQAAIDWMLKNFPEIDPERLYTAGHSSAGTMALLLAQHEMRIKACAAFAPRSDTEGNFNVVVRAAIRRAIPPVEAIFTTFNPSKHVTETKCPVLLFQAQDDPVVPLTETEAFASALRSAGKEVAVEWVPSGGHYDPMIHQGIPRALAFFAAHGGAAGEAATAVSVRGE